jgi:hypothetical protein
VRDEVEPEVEPEGDVDMTPPAVASADVVSPVASRAETLAANAQSTKLSDTMDLPVVAPAAAAAPERVSASDASARFASRPISWKDLREHSDARSLLDAAVRKLGDKVALFAETSEKLPGHTLVGRCDVTDQTHLVLWQYPPSLQVFRALVRKSAAQHVYLIGALQSEAPDATTMLRKLYALVKYAVNHKEGQADPDRLAAALSVDKMSVALALSILKKIHVIDWFAEDGMLFVDLVDQPAGKPEELPEFRQLSSSLAQIAEFRLWCAQTELSEIQLAVVPNALELQAPAATAPSDTSPVQPSAMKVESEV